ncbi:hypothetical protein D0T57_06425 [Dysgonomonas sp. 511]|nr:hypothetical protein [Dysgonomonas sp. 511]
MSRSGISENWHYIGYLIRTGILIALFYINYFILIDKFLFKRKVTFYILINVLLIILAVPLQNILFKLFAGPPPVIPMRRREPNIPRPPYEMRILGDYVLIILAVGMSVAVKATMRWYRDSINLESIKATQLEADLKNLRSQLNPHFLFNTLNNIYSLIAVDTTKAQDAVHRLSGLLRYILYDNDRKFVPIDKELEFTRNYIDLMRLRMSPNMKLDVSIKNDNCNVEIASLLFITLIENAFKHGINNGTDSFINIKILVDKENGVLCTVENSMSDVKDKIEPENSGIGLANLRKRLELLYPYKHELIVQQDKDRFSVLLRIGFDTLK